MAKWQKILSLILMIFLVSQVSLVSASLPGDIQSDSKCGGDLQTRSRCVGGDIQNSPYQLYDEDTKLEDIPDKPKGLTDVQLAIIILFGLMILCLLFWLLFGRRKKEKKKEIPKV